jgi:hypothetical protein
MLLFVTNSGFQERVGGRVFVLKERVVVAPKFRSFSSHIFLQASQNVTVKVRVHRTVRGEKFTVNNPLHVEKIMSMLFVELRVFFALGGCGLFQCDDCCFVFGS